MFFDPLAQPSPLSVRETAFISAGAAILGGLLGGFFSGTYLHLHEWWRRPKLQVDYEGKDDANKVLVEYTKKEGTQVAEIYIRARVRNAGRRVAKGCRVFLTSLEEVQQAGKTTPTVFHDAMQLAWAGGEFVAQDVPNGVEFYADLTHISKLRPGWSFSVKRLFANHEVLKNYKGTYRFHLLATAENASPATIEVDISYNGDWHNLRAVQV
jgi:hypothetical protein